MIGQSLKNLRSTAINLSSKLALRKSQKTFLESHKHLNVYSSLRPKVGKVFTDPDLEERKGNVLDECRLQLVNLGIEEAEKDIVKLKNKYHDFFTSIRVNHSKSEYVEITRLAKRNEKRVLSTKLAKHNTKVERLQQRLQLTDLPVPIPSGSNVERPQKHGDTKRLQRQARNRRRCLKNKNKRNTFLAERVEAIKESGFVVNFTNIEVPDCAYLLLAKGNSFVPSISASKHDIVFDLNEFLRKLSWRTYFHTMPNTSDSNGPDNATTNKFDGSNKLQLKSNKWPIISNKLLTIVLNKIRYFADSINITKIKKYDNLTYVEREGLDWCVQMKNSNQIHFSQADKGGATVLMDPVSVNTVIFDKLCNPQKFNKLDYDPRREVEFNLHNLCKETCKGNGLTKDELFQITGHTDSGKSHNPKFQSGKPHPFPLFKLHSLSTEDLKAKVIPPIRLVTSMEYGPTKRLSLFIDSILNPIAKEFCGREYLKDTPHFLAKLASNEGSLCRPGVQIFTLDVKALYPSIKPDLLPRAVTAALDVVTDFTAERKKAIVELVNFSVSNAVVHYKDNWWKMFEGIPTGGSDSVCLANIYMKWVVMSFFTKTDVASSNIKCLAIMFRFIDDLFGGWLGTYRQFKQFLNVFNEFGKEYGIQFDKEQFGDTVNFLDVTVSNMTGSIVTDLYIKPTDARRYLHHGSFHPRHTFDGIPFSQMRRTALICSNNYLRDLAIDEMIVNFVKCGYKANKLSQAKLKVQQLKRSELLKGSKNLPDLQVAKRSLVCVLPFSVDAKHIKLFIKSLSRDIEQLTGVNDILFSFRRNCNVGSLLFNKFGFAQNKRTFSSQRCETRNCSSCKLKFPDNSRVRITPNFNLKPSKNLNCKSECVIYSAICKVCGDFYFGKTFNEDHIRMNGHREKFCQEKFDKSALSMHVYTDHPERMGNSADEGLSNYNVVLLETVNADNLMRRESFYIWTTDADVRHLNRYKVI